MTWTATERELTDEHDQEWLVTAIRDQQTRLVCQMSAAPDNPAAIEEMRVRARLICQAEAMLNLITDMQAWPVEPIEGSYAAILVQKARAIIAATVDRADIGHEK